MGGTGSALALDAPEEDVTLRSHVTTFLTLTEVDSENPPPTVASSVVVALDRFSLEKCPKFSNLLEGGTADGGWTGHEAAVEVAATAADGEDEEEGRRRSELKMIQHQSCRKSPERTIKDFAEDDCHITGGTKECGASGSGSTRCLFMKD